MCYLCVIWKLALGLQDPFLRPTRFGSHHAWARMCECLCVYTARHSDVADCIEMCGTLHCVCECSCVCVCVHCIERCGILQVRTYVNIYIYVYVHIYMNEICCFYQFFCAFVCVCVYCIERCGANVCIYIYISARPNQSCMFPYRWTDFRKLFDLSFSTIFKILFRRFNSPESDPPHKIMRYWVYYSTQLCSWFQYDRNLSGGNDLYWRCTRFEKAFWQGRPLNILHDS